MKNEVFQWLSTIGLAKGDGIVIGVSGGPDSMALLHLLNRFRLDHTSVRLYIAHLHHGLRETANRDAQFVQEQAELFGITYYPCYADIQKEAREHGLSVEMMGRRRRYAHFSEIQKLTKSRFVATGHHRSDQIESILLHIVRGTGVDGLIGMRRKKGGLLRPLLPYDKEQIIAYVEKQGIEYRWDETNAQTHYTRNFLRHEVVPSLRKVNPRIDQALLTLSDNAEDAQCIIAEAVSDFFSGHRTGQQEILLEAHAFSSVSSALQRAIIRACVVELKGNPEGLTRAQIEEIAKVWHSRTGAYTRLSGLEFAVTQSGLLAKEVVQQIPDAIPLASVGDEFRWGDFQFTKSRAALWEPSDVKDPTVLYLPEAVAAQAVLRVRDPKDWIQPFGMKGRKSIAESMRDLKLRVDLRDTWPLFCIGDEVAWIVGHQKSEKTRCQEGINYIRYQWRREDMNAPIR